MVGGCSSGIRRGNWVGAKWAPLGFGETQQFDEGPAADLARIGALWTSVVHDIAGAILAELALTKIDHAMEVLGVLAVEEEIARRGAIEVAAYQVGVVTPQSVGVGELGEGTRQVRRIVGAFINAEERGSQRCIWVLILGNGADRGHDRQ